jgi:hypothetical protein
MNTLGQKLKGGEQRDAIHIAILPVLCDDDCLDPGQRVKLVHGTSNMVRAVAGPEYDDPGLGIIDPFLPESVERGERVWMFMLPNTITGLRHDWTHPAVDNAAKVTSDSEKWLHSFADRWCFDYDEMIRAALAPDSLASGQFAVARGRTLHGKSELGEDHDLFWHHLQIITGREYAAEHREKFGWSCTC